MPIYVATESLCMLQLPIACHTGLHICPIIAVEMNPAMVMTSGVRAAFKLDSPYSLCTAAAIWALLFL